MSKLYNNYLALKKENESTLFLFKSGIFYIFLDEDATKISNILGVSKSEAVKTFSGFVLVCA